MSKITKTIELTLIVNEKGNAEIGIKAPGASSIEIIAILEIAKGKVTQDLFKI
jgi:hypothetical protein